MTVESAVGALVGEFKTTGRIVIVGASLAGLRAAETLREEGFRGRLTSAPRSLRLWMSSTTGAAR